MTSNRLFGLSGLFVAFLFPSFALSEVVAGDFTCRVRDNFEVGIGFDGRTFIEKREVGEQFVIHYEINHWPIIQKATVTFGTDFFHNHRDIQTIFDAKDSNDLSVMNPDAEVPFVVLNHGKEFSVSMIGWHIPEFTMIFKNGVWLGAYSYSFSGHSGASAITTLSVCDTNPEDYEVFVDTLLSYVN
ncbi:hypothetical protein [Marivivens donghaensis]|uniref:hypothetical protein n=1 Tax=Marivivens donghaensis TaxID=1699413 RepID=UPI00201F1B07|nr:hypothetical protein [Marivivens donghaensis]MCL7409994.1 hypothetical protein [Marivivens donghaensis]MDN3705405.1 hypothetical protein [Marivivens donghaensis]